MDERLRELGPTGLRVTAICVGTASLGSASYTYGTAVSAEQGESVVETALAGPFNFIDTSNAYGQGASETCIGTVLRRRGGLPDGIVLATKVDADPVTRDFSGDRVRRSVEESLTRLGQDSVQLMYLHDPEYHLSFAEAMAPDGPVAALVALRDEGVLQHLGIASGPVELTRQFLATEVFQVVLNHNRYTLVDRSAEPLIQDAYDRGVGFVNAAPYGGGILVKGPEAQPRYAYRSPSDAVLGAVHEMRRVCAAHRIPLAAAALQFSLRDRRIAATVVGVSSPERITATLDLACREIPAAVWDELAALAPGPEHWLH